MGSTVTRAITRYVGAPQSNCGPRRVSVRLAMEGLSLGCSSSHPSGIVLDDEVTMNFAALAQVALACRRSRRRSPGSSARSAPRWSESGVGRPRALEPPTFGTTIRISRLRYPSCVTWRASDLRFL
jgi:hypothetical protein